MIAAMMPFARVGRTDHGEWKGGSVARTIAVGLCIGFAVMLLSNWLLYGSPLGGSLWTYAFEFWGVFYGCFGAVAGTGLALALWPRRRSRSTRRIGLGILAGTFLLFGTAVMWCIAMWGVPPFTFEGAWMYPLGLVSLGFGVLTIRLARRSGRADAALPNKQGNMS